MGITGSGGRVLSRQIPGTYVNELVAQVRAVELFHPEARTVIEIGGQDSKLLVLEERDGRLELVDFSLNTQCAAGTGSFLEQQAARLGLTVQEFAELATKAVDPPYIAGRCAVFAKSDIIHLQQVGTPLPEIVKGLCLALARNFRSDVARGKPFRPPIVFQGGVARNRGMVQAFREVLGVGEADLIVPEHHLFMPAIGAAIIAGESSGGTGFRWEEVREALRAMASRDQGAGSLPPLEGGNGRPWEGLEGDGAEGFVGIDVGSISTKAVAIDGDGRLLAKVYLRTRGDPLGATRRALKLLGEKLGPGFRVLGAGVTGSGRELVGRYVGADLVRNEITAQARAAYHLDPEVDTVFEIGGQDSKYIRLEEGVVVDFTMNRACAAGTGSFLEEQAARLGIPRSLVVWELFPFFREFLREPEYEVLLSPATNRAIVDLTLEEAPPTSCFPSKVSHGHVRFLLGEGVDALFIPAVVDAHHPDTSTKTNYNCPLVQAQPYILAGGIEFPAQGVRVVDAPFHFYHPELLGRELAAVGEGLGAGRGRVRRAIRAAWEAQTSARERLRELGREALGLVRGGDVPGLVILARPYNSCDPGLNLGVPEKLLALEAIPIPVDLLPWEDVDIDRFYPFMQWHSGKRILAAVEFIRSEEGLWPVYLTHFNCGPDSFIMHYVREGLRGKPFLTLELDEHTADAGVITRLEAYLDSVRSFRARPRSPRPEPAPKREFDREKTIYLPYMCDRNRALEGALAHFGYRAETLPPPDEESLVLGRRHATGGECLPFTLTTGDFLKLLRRPDFDPRRSCLFMATSTGPCRFCHYFAAQRTILRRLGHEVDFISLEAYDAYTIRDLGTAFRRTAWYGIAAVDLLQKCLWSIRPYEVHRGETDEVCRWAVERMREALASGGSAGFWPCSPGSSIASAGSRRSLRSVPSSGSWGRST